MRYSKYEQVKIITDESFAVLEQKFNAAMIELSKFRPTREMLDPHTWAIFYTEEIEIPETESERREISRTEIHCKDCEHFRLILNRDGTENRVTKHAKCDLWGCSVLKNGKAKDMCYEKFAKEGKTE